MKQKAAYSVIDFDSLDLIATKVLKCMYNRYTDMMLSGFYVEGAQGRILGILDLKLADAHELLRKGIVYTRCVSASGTPHMPHTTRVNNPRLCHTRHLLITPAGRKFKTWSKFGYQPIAIWNLQKAILRFFLGTRPHVII